MTIGIPDVLTSDNAGKYVMSIRLEPDGLSFSGFDPSVGGSFFYREAEFDRTVPYVLSLKEFFFAHDFLTWSYKRTHVICVTPMYTIVPETYFEGDRKKQLLDFCFCKEGDFCLSDSLKDDKAELVFDLEKDVYEFCSRSLLNPLFTHPMRFLLPLWREQSLGTPVRRLYVVMERKQMNVACYKQGALLFVNSFRIDQPEDAIYYILYVWKRLGLDQQVDQLCLQGESSMQISVSNTLRLYLRQVLPMEIPSEAYLCGSDVVRSPLDIISWLVCE